MLVAALVIAAVLSPAVQQPTERGALAAKEFAAGNAHFEKRENEQALAAYDKAIALEPANPDFHIARCRTLARLMRHADAIPACSEALRLRSDDPVALRWRGHFNINLRRFEAALADLNAVAARRQDDSEIYYHLGLARYLTGDFGGAAQAFRRCLELAKNDDDVVAAVAWLYPSLVRAKLEEEAKQALARITPAMKVAENTAYHDRLLLLQGTRKETEVAEAMKKDALSRPTVGYGIGLWHLLNGRRDEAIRYFQQAATSDYPAAFGHIAAEVELKRLGVTTGAANASPYLLVWTGDAERKSSDFLVVLDADPDSRTYGRVLTTVAVGSTATMPHHTEYVLASDSLFANGWAAGKTFVFDLRRPEAPVLKGSFGAVGDYSFPHSFARLRNGNLLGVFQGLNSYAPPGGLVELDNDGQLVRATSAATPDVADELVWPYSLELDVQRDRVVTTSTPMGLPAWATPPDGSWRSDRTDPIVTRHVQVWSLSRLELLRTIALPESGKGQHHEYPAEPRLLHDGSMYVNTFRCGLYRLTGIEGHAPRAEFVHAFPGGDQLHNMCSVPVVVGNYWIQTVAELPGLIALDISDPARPVEVSRLKLGRGFHMPHWVAADRGRSRVVVTGAGQDYVLIVNVDPRTGALTIDGRFRDAKSKAPGVRLAGKRWPHGGNAAGIAHGAVFAPR